MQLRRYQQGVLDALRDYLAALRAETAAGPGWTARAWQRLGRDADSYRPRADGAGRELPAVCLQVPTGGGKTLLAVHALDAINRLYRGAPHGLVLWVVPTSQIYRQTLTALRDRAHPYRQALDVGSGGRTRVLERDDPLGPADLRGQLAVLLLMLPSANRRDKTALRLFHDHGGLAAFFPPDEDWQAQADLLRRAPNLDAYPGGLGPVVKSSLANTLRLLRPLLILDEGHLAYSPVAQSTLLGLNPSFVLELSATPPPGSNLLAAVGGRQLHAEGMIKLDLNLHRRAADDWRDTLRASHDRRTALERAAQGYAASGGPYIRPICLVQVERTGAAQCGQGHIHAEDARAFLAERCGVPPAQIAVKSSERDEIERLDLLAESCQIRYLITRRALQEGWDCPFAYVLAVLTSPASATGLTQLVGRVLRQPYARRTGVPALDQSYVYYHRSSAEQMLALVRGALAQEGLGDLAGHVLAAGRPATAERLGQHDRTTPARQLLIEDGRGGLRRLCYEEDVLRRVDWSQIDLGGLAALPPPADDGPEAAAQPPDPVGLTRQLCEIVPNPWAAHALVCEALGLLRERWGDGALRRSASAAAEALRQLLGSERARLARAALDGLAHEGALRWYDSGEAAAASGEDWERSARALLHPQR